MSKINKPIGEAFPPYNQSIEEDTGIPARDVDPRGHIRISLNPKHLRDAGFTDIEIHKEDDGSVSIFAEAPMVKNIFTKDVESMLGNTIGEEMAEALLNKLTAQINRTVMIGLLSK